MSENRDLPCPECGGDLLRVKDTRFVNGRLRRRRECLAGHRATTYELLATDPAPIAAAIADVEAGMRRLFAVVEERTEVLNRTGPRGGTKKGDAAA